MNDLLELNKFVSFHFFPSGSVSGSKWSSAWIRIWIWMYADLKLRIAVLMLTTFSRAIENFILYHEHKFFEEPVQMLTRRKCWYVNS